MPISCGVKLGTMARFLSGNATAIQAVARDRTAIWTGLVLVLLTAVARNYDQMFLTESAMWLAGPPIFSFVSGSFMFVVLARGFIGRHVEDAKRARSFQQWRSFMTLFWMTAPIAWVYAIPMERLFDSYRAAQANLALLAIVSLWRVLLMSRVVAVLQGIPFLRALGWIMVPASLEVILVVFVGGIFSPAFGRKIMAGMGGMRNAPEENLMLAALANVMAGALAILALVLVLLALRRFYGTVQPFPEQESGRIPVLALLALTTLWIGIAIPAQREQRRFLIHAALVSAGDYRKSLDFLSAHSREDFPASRRIEPNPYEHRVWEHLPKVVAELRGDDPEWVRRLCLSYLKTVFDHHFLRGDAGSWARMFEALERLPGAKEWVAQNSGEFAVFGARIKNLRSPTPEQQTGNWKRIREALARLGIEVEDEGDR